ncbi:MAG: diguanylate cyclase [Zoogloeaceae bacterium]|jgi:diguanylate cyclase (GGDEF)-like protein|nr:diguanylate cyclase [Zoogloeaceae bacterium]
MKSSTLFSILRRVNLFGFLLGVALSCLILGMLTFSSLHSQVNTNLHLLARTIAYSTEASLMFDDQVTAKEILSQTLARESVRAIRIDRAQGTRFAEVAEPARHGRLRLFERLVDTFFAPPTTTVPIISNDQTLGYVTVFGRSEIFVSFLSEFLQVFFIALLLSGGLVLALTHYEERRIVRELDELVKNTFRRGASQGERDLSIAEFRQIDAQFRNLLTELEATNNQLLAQKNELEEDNASLNQKANHDPLTGLANRAWFAQCVERSLDQAKASGRQIALLYCDSDHFKEINDRYGHGVGDMFLVLTAQRMHQVVRHTDLVARLGGDEFAILLNSGASADIAKRIAQKLLETPPFIVLDAGRQIQLQLSQSIGIALYPDAATTVATLIAAADHAMYRAKKAGGRRHEIAPSIARAEFVPQAANTHSNPIPQEIEDANQHLEYAKA